jgi:hypothetical protein
MPAMPAPGQWPNADRRLNKRHGPEQITLTFLGADHPVLNWSQGGALVADCHPQLAIGSTVSGVLSIRGHNGLFRFSAKLLRRNERTREIALRFDKLSPTVSDVLSRTTEET